MSYRTRFTTIEDLDFDDGPSFTTDDPMSAMVWVKASDYNAQTETFRIWLFDGAYRPRMGSRIRYYDSDADAIPTIYSSSFDVDKIIDAAEEYMDAATGIEDTGCEDDEDNAIYFLVGAYAGQVHVEAETPDYSDEGPDTDQSRFQVPLFSAESLDEAREKLATYMGHDLNTV